MTEPVAYANKSQSEMQAYTGLDVHGRNHRGRRGRARWKVPSRQWICNRPEAAEPLAKLGPADTIRVCYEAGPTGYTLYWQLTALGVHCDVIAPSLIPRKAGDRRDRPGDAAVGKPLSAGDRRPVPTPVTEAFRDLVRAREAYEGDQLRARHRVSKFLLRHGRQRPDGMSTWMLKHAQWLVQQRFARTLQVVYDEYRATLGCSLRSRPRASIAPYLHGARDAGAHAAARAGRRPGNVGGVKEATAATLVCELGTLRRFGTARQVMGYAGLVPREHSSGSGIHRGAMKTGNASPAGAGRSCC